MSAAAGAANGAAPGPRPVLKLALSLAAQDLPVFPCNNSKRPCIPKKEGGNGLLDASTVQARVRVMFAHENAELIGVPTGAASGFDVLDVDPRHGGDAWERANLHRLPETRIHQTQSGGRHYLFVRAPGLRNSQSLIAPGVDVRAEGGYVIYPPSRGYTVISEAELAPWPDWLLPLAMQPAAPARQPAQGEGVQEPVSFVRGLALIQGELKKLAATPKGKKHLARLTIGRTIGGYAALAGLSDDTLTEMMLSALPPQSGRDSEEKTIRDALSHGRAAPFRLEERPYSGNGRARHEAPAPPPGPAPGPGEPDEDPGPDEPTVAGFELTEDGLARAFTKLHGDELRYCHHTGAWFRWTGQYWRRDETKVAFDWARQTCRELAAGAPKKVRATIARAATATAVERFAQADEVHAVTSEIWDRDPFLVGTPGGTIDLRTGEMRPPLQSDYITRQTAVAPAQSPETPLWDQFLREAAGGDDGLIRFLRQWFGYALTGDTREHALLFAHGEGGNGKGTLLNTIEAIAGDYARTAPMEAFTANQTGHPTELAMLRGARLVCASETEEGTAWAMSRIKQLTGGDRIAARFMRQDFFEYRPQFKLTIIGNHKPQLKNVDDAVRRRFNVVSFPHKPASPDLQLEVKLRAEWPGILRWMIEGCLDWQLHGLVRPRVVTEATDAYFEAQNHFGRWLADCAKLDPTLNEKPGILFASFRDWCARNGEPQPDNRTMRGMLERTPGVKYVTNNGTQLVRGAGLNAPPKKPTPEEPDAQEPEE